MFLYKQRCSACSLAHVGRLQALLAVYSSIGCGRDCLTELDEGTDCGDATTASACAVTTLPACSGGSQTLGRTESLDSFLNSGGLDSDAPGEAPADAPFTPISPSGPPSSSESARLPLHHLPLQQARRDLVPKQVYA